MLNQELLSALKSYTQNMANDVTLVLQTGEHQKRDELKNFLADFTSVSDKLNLVEADYPQVLNSPISFGLQVDNEFNGVFFSGIPGGHEFSSLVLAVLQSSGTASKLDQATIELVKSVQEPLKFEVFISLSCHNCPDVVQSLNQFALLNPLISTEMIDGGLFPEIIEQRNIQGVPSVYLNGEVFANGKVEISQILEKLREKYPNLTSAAKVEKLPLQDVTVIGGGPAGVAAAIYAARKGLEVTMVADRIGGQVKDTVDIENLISVPKTTGNELSANMMTHLNEYPVTLKQHVKVDKVTKGATKQLELSSGEVIDTKTLIVATGAKWRELGIPGERENVGSGVAYCPHCDGPFFKGKNVVVVGGGNSGVEAALDLAGMVNHVTLIEFMPELKADKVLVDKAVASDKIDIITSAACQQVLAEDGKVVGIEYQDRNSEELKVVNAAGIFVQIGLSPNSDFIDGVVDLTRFGEIIINEKNQTSEEGIFACGDVTTVPYKQIVIAMGEGSKASLSAFDYIMRS